MLQRIESADCAGHGRFRTAVETSSSIDQTGEEIRWETRGRKRERERESGKYNILPLSREFEARDG